MKNRKSSTFARFKFLVVNAMDAVKIKGYVCALISAVTYGLIPLFILPLKAIHFSMDVTLFYRFFISAGIMLILLRYKKEHLKLKTKEIGVFLALGILFSLSSDLLFLAYDRLSAGIASTILFVFPVIVAIIMAVFFRERISTIMVISMAITLSGIYVLSGASTASINFNGLALALGSALAYALYIVTVNKSNIKASGVKTTFYSLLFSALYYFIKSLIGRESLAVPDLHILLHITLFGLITSVVSITTLVYAIGYIGSTPTAILGALEPVVAVIISVMLFGEKLTFALLLGVLLIVGGVLVSIVFSKARTAEEEVSAA
ncbi:DMT family transporter [Pedobacter soli]|uniref:Threonine/homoserine efflux transporter RhtA n=1 Tax=Pedobacter soli TaxID=390242 RepID=A0A1G6S5W3_9SPHI|nr:DMT family transporter [Pedobacter soli]SDD12322.1 Threonine/homoserine efflux transporter RhtA [Pedobacter soli]